MPSGSSPSPPEHPQIIEVSALLRRRQADQVKPTDADLFPVYNFLLHSHSTAEPINSRKYGHWYCARCPSELHREAATYLLFLFAFRREGTSKTWVDALEAVLLRCEKCARAFGTSRRRFGEKYMSNYPAATRTNFFGAVDKWQSALLIAEHAKTSQPSYGSTSNQGESFLFLSSAVIQLLLGEPSLLEDPRISTLLDDSIIRAPTPSGNSVITSLGLSPGLVRLLGSSKGSRRRWALAHLPFASRRPLSLAEWCELGICFEVQRLYLEPGDAEVQWEALSTLLRCKAFAAETIRKGLIGGQTKMEESSVTGRGIMVTLSAQFGVETDYFELILETFSLLLQSCPNQQFWSFDPSPELPHTLFSDLKNNPVYLEILEAAYPCAPSMPMSPPAEGSRSSKSKGPASLGGFNPLDWLSGYLFSVIDADLVDHHDDKLSTGFAEALAKVSSFCLQDMQHDRFPGELRAAAANAGITTLAMLHDRLKDNKGPQGSALFSNLDVHAKYITSVAFRARDHPLPIWLSPRTAAQRLIGRIFRQDGRDIVESFLGLAAIHHNEEKRKQKVRRTNKPPLPAVRVENLHRAAVTKEIWTMTYDDLSPTDPIGAGVVIVGVAAFAHVEPLDRMSAWAHKKVSEVVGEKDWTASIRALNNSLDIATRPLPHTLEALAMRPDHSRKLWQQPNVPESAILLLLSPTAQTHDSTISLIQQSFEDVDDRADCFRALLSHYPSESMDGLAVFLQNFIRAASMTPESCSLAKWFVRCFHDILDVLCRPSVVGDALLQSHSFLSAYHNGKAMHRRITDVWQLMNTALAVIFKRTIDWAPLFANDIMIDWMRDALIFGRQMAESVRVFEAATYEQISKAGEEHAQGSTRLTTTGKNMIQKLQIVLTDLVAWLRLTDLETLHQTFELMKTILFWVHKAEPDLSQSPLLENTLREIDRFCRRDGTRYRNRLSDDQLAELSELLHPFDLGISAEDEIQFVKSVEAAQRITSVHAAHDNADPVPKDPSHLGTWSNPVHYKSATGTSTASKDAFVELMKSRGAKVPPAGLPTPSSAQAKTAASGSSKNPISLEDIENDDFLDQLSVNDLEIIENRAKITTSLTRPHQSVPRNQLTSRPPQLQSGKVQVSVASKPTIPRPVAGSNFKSSLMKQARLDHQHQLAERQRDIGGITRRLPAASALGTGLGAYQPPRRAVPIAESSGSSSDSSDDENRGVAALLAKHKSPKKLQRAVERRPIKVLGANVANIVRDQDDRRRKQHATKMRLKPDMSLLFRYVLSWDPNHTGPAAPHLPRFAAELATLKAVPTTFVGSKQYEQTMLPLFMQELWAQFIKDTNHEAPIVVNIASRMYEDDFIDLDTRIALSGGNLSDRFFLNETDIVTLQQPGNPHRIFAKVQMFKRGRETAIKLRIAREHDQAELSVKAKCQLRKHTSLSTAAREFAALRGLAYYEDGILGDILSAQSAPLPTLSQEAIHQAMSSFDLNEPQSRAVLGAFGVEGFALIQGPPGTGKTKTISGLVGKFMSDRKAAISINGEKPSKAKILVCAPSNAAIDEVCKRLMNGIPSASGGRINPSIVRVGIDSSVNVAVKDVSLDLLVEAKVNADVASRGGSGGEYSRIQDDLIEIKTLITTKQDELQRSKGYVEGEKAMENDLHALIARRTQLGQQLSKAKDSARDATRHLDAARRLAKDEILKEADIICSTLTGAGHEILAPYTFETVIIDEAAQAIEMSCLIPLKYGCRRCVMVGDPNQLPPTTFSSDAERCQYNESLFVRLARHNSAHIQLLSIQYRMHPFISELPSKVFYHGKLLDGQNMAQKTKAVWHERKIFGPYRFFNVEGHETKSGTSTLNVQEALVAVDLYRQLEADFGSRINLAFRIGVISMYKEQVWEMKRKFTEAFGATILQNIDFNTVDGFQGQEKDIIILSCVRSGPNLRTIGFLKDARRMNVALTRAKSSLFVIGNGPTLERSDNRWRTIIGDARERGFLVQYTSTTFASESPSRGKNSISPPPKKKVKKERATSPSNSKLESSTSRRISVSVEGHQPPLANGTTPLKHKLSQESVRKERKRKREDPADISAGPSKSRVHGNGSIASMAKPNLTEPRISVPAPPPTLLSSIHAPPPGPPRLLAPPPAKATKSAKPEDVAFIKKKKKKPRPTQSSEPQVDNRPAVNNQLNEH